MKGRARIIWLCVCIESFDASIEREKKSGLLPFLWSIFRAEELDFTAQTGFMSGRLHGHKEQDAAATDERLERHIRADKRALPGAVSTDRLDQKRCRPWVSLPCHPVPSLTEPKQPSDG